MTYLNFIVSIGVIRPGIIMLYNFISTNSDGPCAVLAAILKWLGMYCFIADFTQTKLSASYLSE